jgi:hypothetical protein
MNRKMFLLLAALAVVAFSGIGCDGDDLAPHNVQVQALKETSRKQTNRAANDIINTSNNANSVSITYPPLSVEQNHTANIYYRTGKSKIFLNTL